MTRRLVFLTVFAVLAVAGLAARAADPVCNLSPRHALVEQLAAVREDAAYSYRSS